MKRMIVLGAVMLLTLPSFAGVVSEAQAKTAKQAHERHVKEAQELLDRKAELQKALDEVNEDLALLDQDKDMKRETLTRTDGSIFLTAAPTWNAITTCDLNGR